MSESSKQQSRYSSGLEKAAILLDEQARRLRDPCLDKDGHFGCEDCDHHDECKRECDELTQAAADVRSAATLSERGTSEEAKDAARWRAAVSQVEFPIQRCGQWFHVLRPEGRIIEADTVAEVMDQVIASQSAERPDSSKEKT